jgi:hypothetical protein
MDSPESDESWEDITRMYPHKSWKPPIKYWMRVKKTDTFLDPPSPASETTNMADTIGMVEYELFENGLVAKLAKYKASWLEIGKEHAWESFAHALPMLYPSSSMPEAPPVENSQDAKVAVKIAMIESFDPESEIALSSLRGDEGWTRDDDAFWDIVEVDLSVPAPVLPEMPAEKVEQWEECLEQIAGDDALYRRSGLASVHLQGEKEGVLEKWLEQVNPSFIPPATPITTRSPDEVSEGGEDISGDDVVAWEHKYLPKGDECSFCCDICEGMSSKEQAARMHSNSTDKRRQSSTSQYTLVGLPSTTRRHKCHSSRISINVPRLSIDTGIEGDVDTPRKTVFVRNPKALCNSKLEGTMNQTSRSGDDAFLQTTPKQLTTPESGAAAPWTV